MNRIEFKIIEESKNNSDLIKIEELNKVTEIKDSILNYNRLNPNLNFENFIKGKSNDIALSYSKKICEHLSRYNPLYICGGVGLGKTHLLNAIGLELQGENNVMFISAERFMYHFIKSIKKMIWLILKIFFENPLYLSLMIFNLLEAKKVYRKNFFILLIALWKKVRK